MADSSRLTGICTNRSSRSTASITPVSQLSGSDAMSFTPQPASSSAMRRPISDGLSFMDGLRSLASGPAARVAQRAPDGFGGDRQRDVAHAQMPQRVDYGVADRGRRADRAALARPLHAERIARRRRDDEGGVKRG